MSAGEKTHHLQYQHEREVKSLIFKNIKAREITENQKISHVRSK